MRLLNNQNKKGVQFTFGVIVAIIIALMVLTVILVIFVKNVDRSSTTIDVVVDKLEYQTACMVKYGAGSDYDACVKRCLEQRPQPIECKPQRPKQ